MPVVGASASLPDIKKGAVTDFDGRFTIDHRSPFPVTLLVQFIGYADQRIELTAPNSSLKVKLRPDTEMLQEVSVVERRLSEKQKASALTVEAMDAIAMKETPSVSFYEGLGNLKGVDRPLPALDSRSSIPEASIPLHPFARFSSSMEWTIRLQD